MTADDELTTSRMGRIARLTSLGTRVAGSLIGGKVAAAFKRGEAKDEAIARIHRKNAERVVETLGQLKGAAMKLGQSIAVMGGELPPEAAAVYRKLFDAAPPVEFGTIRGALEQSLGGKIEDLFEEFEAEPIGSASLAQAHAAVLPDGTRVIVKVLYPGIENSVDSDLKILRTTMKTGRLMRRTKAELDGMFEELRARLTEELDYEHEAANIDAFQILPEHVKGMRVPGVHRSHSSDRVLTMDRLDGVSFETFLDTASDAAKKRAGDTLLEMCLVTMYKLRMIHGDPHGGNFLFSPEGEIGLIDYGCVKFFPADKVLGVAGYVDGIANADRGQTLDALRQFGVLNTDEEGAHELLWEASTLIGGMLAQPEFVAGVGEAEVVEGFKTLGKRFLKYPAITYPSEFVFMDRAFGGIYGMLARLQHVAPYGPKLIEHARSALDAAPW